MKYQLEHRALPALVAALTIVLGACTAQTETPQAAASRIVKELGRGANVTQVLQGAVTNKPGASQLWCIETDGKAADGMTTLLFIVTEQGGKWTGEELTDGEYQWDLYGCPR